MRRLALLMGLFLPACAEEASTAGEDSAVASAPASASPVVPTNSVAAPEPPRASPERTAATRSSRYTSLRDCVLEKSAPEEAGYSVQLCPGVGARLRLIEADGRQNLFVLPSGGDEQRLDLPSRTGGGFSSLGDQAEWRGASAGPDFRPDALIVRYAVVEQPERPTQPTSYLVVIRTRPGRACVTARVPPGPGQNEAARRLADTPGTPCLPGPG